MPLEKKKNGNWSKSELEASLKEYTDEVANMEKFNPFVKQYRSLKKLIILIKQALKSGTYTK